MKKHIAEELPTRKHPAAVVDREDGDQKKKGGESSEKRVRQAVYDIRYRARREGVDLKQAFSQYMQNSSMAANERTLVKQKLFGKSLGEEYGIFESATDTVSKALYKVFVEGYSIDELALVYEEEIKVSPDKKHKVEVVDKNSGRSYIRYATREKINDLRLNPNIADVKVLDPRDMRTPYEGERKKGEQTARVAAGKSLDPVGKEDNDPDNDGVPINRDKNDQYIMKRRAAVGDAIQKRKGLGEDFIGEKKIDGKIDIMKGKTNSSCVKVFPDDGEATKSTMGTISASYNSWGEMISETAYEKFLRKVKDLQEKAESEQQQKLFGLALSVKRGETPRSEVSAEVLKIVDTMSEKKIRDFAKTKHEGLPKKVEEEKESECSSGEGEEDKRGKYAKIAMVTNKLRAMGMKNPIVMTAGYEPEGEMVEARYYGRGRRGPDRNALGGADRDDSPKYRYLGSPTPRQEEEERRRADEAEERAKERLRANLASEREEARKRR